MYLSEVYGKGGIYAKCVAASIANNIPIYTLETKAPKFIDAEFEKHRMLSSNSSSSRAIPFKPLDELYIPFDIRKNQKGMQGYGKLEGEILSDFQADIYNLYQRTFDYLTDDSFDYPKWSEIIHKQHLNRYIEPWVFQKKVITATEWDNFFKLRLAPDAQPEIQELARCMKEVIEQVKGKKKKLEYSYNEYWHLPYTTFEEFILPDGPGQECYELNLRIKCSVARCARVSYMNHDNTEPDIEKDLELYDTLLESKHMTPFEHQAAPMNFISIHGADNPWENGVTHTDRNGRFWSGNFRGWIQNRQLLEDWNE